MLPAQIADVLCTLIPCIPADTQWAVSCGSALALHGLDHRPSDLDLFAGQQHGAVIAAALGDLGVRFPYAERVSRHITSHWGRFVAGGIEIDVVGDFAVRRHGRTIVWDACHPCWRRLDVISVRGVHVPVFALEDLIGLYEALDEDDKVHLVKTSSLHGIRTWA